MVTVRNNPELDAALKNKADSIRIEGQYAKTFARTIRSRRKKSKAAIGLGALALTGGIAAAPFTGGTSLAGSVMRATAMGLTIGTATISAGELAMILGFAAYALYRKYTIKIEKGDKSIEMSPSR